MKSRSDMETFAVKEAAQRYISAGLVALPASRARKFPTVGKWGKYRKRPPTEAELSAWFANGPDAVCILCGKASGNTEIMDFDAGGELFDAWRAKVQQVAPGLFEKLAIQSTQRDGRHGAYQMEGTVPGSAKLAQGIRDGELTALIETRGEGGLFLCAPTPGYKIIQGDLCKLPVLSEDERAILWQCARELSEIADNQALSVNDSDNAACPSHNSHNSTCVSDNGHSGPLSANSSHNAPLSAHHANNPHISAHNANSSHPASPVGYAVASRPGDDFNSRGELRPLLEKHGWAFLRSDDQNEFWRRPGKPHGQSATFNGEHFYVFSSNAHPFEPNQAYTLFAVYALLDHGGDFSTATRALSALGFGQSPHVDTGVDISGIVGMSADNPDCVTHNSHNGHSRPDVADPGPIPEHLFHIPGLVARVCGFTLAHAPYPNLGLAFCGAIALQSYLCGRKVRTKGDLRPNIYLLALASSGTGKDFPRKVNSRVLFEIGRVSALGDKFASGEGIQDALMRSNAMLFQNDEMDGVLRQINLDRENKRESIPNILLTLFTSASDIYPVRVKAGQKEAAHIDQPHLTLFGTATPRFFYESLSQRMLTNGLFARMMIVDIGKRGRGQAPGSARDLPEDIINAAKWWDEFTPGTRKSGNLYEVHPEPVVVPFTPEAERSVEQLQRMGEDEYDRADAAGDEIGKAVWSRTCENAKKLALLYACSENHEEPVIGSPAVEWATAFAMHQTRRQLHLAATYVAENPFHAECLKLTRKIKDTGGQMARRQLMRVMRCKAADFDQLIITLVQQGDIEPVDIPTKTRPAQGYRVTS